MEKIIGFFLTRVGGALPDVPFIDRFPWLQETIIERGDWILRVWGHMPFDRLILGNSVVVSCSSADLNSVGVDPLGNRGLVISHETKSDQIQIKNDALGMVTVVYGSKDGVPYVSTCEEMVIESLGSISLNPGRLVSYLLFQGTVADYTLWNEIDKLYANSTLTVSSEGKFEQLKQLPMMFDPVADRDAPHRMFEITQETVRKYTDALDDVFLPLSSGQDSRMILVNMVRPERIHARSYPTSWPPERSWEVMIPKASALKCGVKDHRIIDCTNDYSRYTREALDYFGTLIGATQVYLFGASAMIGGEDHHWPTISGVIGDVLAGIDVRHVYAWLGQGESDWKKFKHAVYCHAKEWSPGDLNQLLEFDWEAALGEVKPTWSRIWCETEGLTRECRADLIRIRNRCTQTIVYPWAALDLWAPIVTVFCDRDYAEFMLSLSPAVLRDRNIQKLVFARHFPHIWPHAGVNPSTWNDKNLMNQVTIRNNPQAFYPIQYPLKGAVLPHIRSDVVNTLCARSLSGDENAFFLLNSLQPLFWAHEKGWL